MRLSEGVGGIRHCATCKRNKHETTHTAKLSYNRLPTQRNSDYIGQRATGKQKRKNRMTCIIGLEHEGKVYMGADSANADDYSINVSGNPKLFRLGPFLIGFTSSWRMGQLLQYQLSDVVIQTIEDDLTYLVRHFIEPVRACLKDYGYAEVKENQETGGYFLIAFNERVYKVQSDFSDLHDVKGVQCVGSGGNYAEAAMLALTALPPKKRIREALKIAAALSPSVCAPFHIEKGR